MWMTSPLPRTTFMVHLFIYSTKPLAHVKSIELDLSLKQLKTLGVVTVKDIPECGSNVGANTIFGPEPLFGDPVTQCAGEPLGVVVWFVVIFRFEEIL